MDLKMEVYSQNLELLGLLEIQNSVIWEKKAFSAGSFSVESLIADESRALLQPENIIWIEGKTAGSIEFLNPNTDKNSIVVKGNTLTGILGRRVLWGLYSLKGTPPEIMHALVDDCCIHPTRGNVEARKIPGLVSLDVPAGGEIIRFQKTGGNLLYVLEELGETYGVAFGVRFNPAVPQMEFWTRWGQNRSIHQTVHEPVLYSTELDDVLSSEYSYNSQNYRNVALVAGEGEGVNRVYVTVGGNGGSTPTPPTPPGPPEPTKYTVTVSVDPAGGGTVTGGGTYEEGAQVTITATSADGYTFSQWTVNGETVGTGESYTFTVTGDTTITAVFSEKPKVLEYYGTAPALKVARNSLAAATVGGFALFCGGNDNSAYLSTVDAYNESLTRTTPTALSKARRKAKATALGGYALFAGGDNSGSIIATVDAYDSSLTRTTPAALSKARRNLAAATAVNYALFGGGYSGNSSLSTVDAYDSSLTRTTPTALSAARDTLVATTFNGYALFAGGDNSGSKLSTVDAYDSSLTRTTPAALSKARSDLAAATVGNFALFAGGYTGSERSNVVDVYTLK